MSRRHTVPAGQEPDRARQLAAAIAAAAERPRGDELRALYEQVAADDVLSIVAPAIEALVALRPSAEAVGEHPGVGADLVDAALCSPSTRNRHGALNVLEAWDPHHWTSVHRDRLRTMAATDPEDHLRARATELLEPTPGRP